MERWRRRHHCIPIHSHLNAFLWLIVVIASTSRDVWNTKQLKWVIPPVRLFLSRYRSVTTFEITMSTKWSFSILYVHDLRSSSNGFYFNSFSVSFDVEMRLNILIIRVRDRKHRLPTSKVLLSTNLNPQVEINIIFQRL